VTVVSAEVPLSTRAGGPEGWRYDRPTARLAANSTEAGTDGLRRVRHATEGHRDGTAANTSYGRASLPAAGHFPREA